MYSARAVCMCVDVGGKRGVGETWRSPTRRLLSAQKLLLHSLSLRLLVQAQLLLHPHHRAVWARRAFSNVARALAWAYQTLMDSSMTWRMNSVPNVWGLEHSMWARCMEGLHGGGAQRCRPLF